MLLTDIGSIHYDGSVTVMARTRTETAPRSTFELEYLVRGGQADWLAPIADAHTLRTRSAKADVA